MKLGIFFENVSPSSGGAFSIFRDLLLGLKDTDAFFEHELYIIGNKNLKEYLPKKVTLVEFPVKNIFLKWIHFNIHNLIKYKKFEFSGRQQFGLNNLLIKNNIDLLWCPFPLRYQIYTPYINTVWDLGHLDYPHLPEFSTIGKNEFKFRENEMSLIIKKAISNVVSNDFLKCKLVSLYGVDPSRIFVIGLPTKVINITNKSFTKIPKLLIYPAQFWPHKNHLTLLKAIKILNEFYDIEIQLKLIGSDRGSKFTIENYIKEFDLSSQVEIIDFVEEDSLSTYYSEASILIFPSLLGPDNLPPIEGLKFGCKVLVSDVNGARDVYGESVTYFDPLNPSNMAICIRDAILTSNLQGEAAIFSKEINKSFVSIGRYLQSISDIVSSMNNQIEIARISQKLSGT